MYLMIVSVAVYTLFYTPCQIAAFEWTESLPNGTQLEVCERSTATFPWGFLLAPGEQVDTVSYHQQLQYGTPDNASENGQGDGMGTHIDSTDPHFTFTPDHQMIINRATAKDTGNYVIKVMVVPAESTEAQSHVTSASLMVKVSPVLEEEGPGLQAKLQPQAVTVTDGPQPGWHVQLSCGTFLSLGQPAVTVTWTTPSGTVLPSTSYESGVFSLIVPKPVESGDYSCQVDPGAPVLACVNYKSMLLAQPAVRVDAIETRVILLEARDTELSARNTELNARNTELTAHDTEQTARITELTASLEDLAKLVDPQSFQDKVNSLQKQLEDHIQSTGAQHERSTVSMPTSCVDVKTFDPVNGVHMLNIYGRNVTVFCDQVADGGGWAVIQRRRDGSVDFYRDWAAYEAGFGNVTGEFWLGLEKIHWLTASRSQTLRVELTDYQGQSAFAKYNQFVIGGPDSNYILRLDDYSGNAGDSMGYHNNCTFSTKDRDNDVNPNNCAIMFTAAWWYKSCMLSHLNGVYSTTQQVGSKFAYWYTWKKKNEALKYVEMKIRPQ